MPINPLNVIKILLVAFQALNIPDGQVNDAEQQLADNFQEILIHAMNKFNGVEILEEITYAEWTPKLGSRTDEAVCTIRKMTKLLTSIINKEQWSFEEVEQEKVIVS